jgi:hypothetical protein
MRTPERRSRTLIKCGGWLARPFLVTVVATALVAAGATAAQAQSVSDTDTAGDMVRYEYGTGESVPAPDHVRNDVLRTRLTHSASRVSVRVKYAEMQRVGEVNALYVQMVTNEGVRRWLDLSAGPGEWAGTTAMYRGNEYRVRCAVRHSMDYARNVGVVSFPRRCAGSPRWIKFRVVSLMIEDDGFFYFDDALDGAPMLEDSAPAQSRRVYRASSN